MPSKVHCSDTPEYQVNVWRSYMIMDHELLFKSGWEVDAGKFGDFSQFRKPPHSYKEVSSPTLQFFPECATLSDIWIGHCIWHVSQAFPHVSALRSDSLAMRVMKLTILFKSVTTVVYVYVLVCGGALFKIELLSSQNFIQYHFPLQVWVRLWSDLAGWCWLYWEWIMPSLLLHRGIRSNNCVHSDDVAISCSGNRVLSTDCSFISTSKLISPFGWDNCAWPL